MTLWHSLFLLICWVVTVSLLGRRLVCLLPRYERYSAMLFLSPAVGLAVYVLLAELVGWTIGMHPGVVVPATAGLTLVSWAWEPRKQELNRYLVTVVLAALLVSFGVMLPIAMVGGYNVFNDTFTYLVHGQWLQSHAFRTPVHPTIYEPAFTQVAIYQRMGLRMGSSFFLAWVQAGSPFKWSIEVYPAVLGTALTCGALAIGGLTYQLTAVRRFSVLWGIAAAAGIGGFAFGAVAGFMPQVFGLTFATAAIASLVPARNRTAPNGQSLRVSEAMPSALLFAAAADAYSELGPLLALALTGSVVLQVLLRPGHWRTIIASALLVTGLSLVLVNAELFRMVRAIMSQKGAVVGWPVPWSAAAFFAHSIGFRSGSGDGDHWLFPSVSHFMPVIGIVIAIGIAVVVLRRGPKQLSRVALPLLYVLGCLVGFAFFRWTVPSPWPTGLGQSWNQFKLSNWVSPVLLAFIGALLADQRGQWWRRAIWGAAITYLLAGLFSHLALNRERVAEMIRLSGRTRDVLRSYFDMQTLVETTPADQPVFIDLGPSEYKSRQLLAYFLQDRKVAADWGDDGYIYPSLPPGWQLLSPQSSPWWIQSAGGDSAINSYSLHSGNFSFGRVPPFTFTRHQVVGGYGMETDASGWWVWAEHKISANFKIHTKLPATVQLRGSFIIAGHTRDLNITVWSQGRPAFTQTVSLQEGWQSYQSVPFALGNDEVSVEITAGGDAVPISQTDPRRVSMLVKNVRFEPAGSTAR